MKLINLLSSIILSYLTKKALSFPAPHICTETPRIFFESDSYLLPPEMMTGASCSAPCVLTSGQSHTVSVQTEFSVGVGLGLNVLELLDIGVDFELKKTWSTTNVTSTSAAIQCRGDGYECGLTVEARVVKITGESSPPRKCDLGPTWEPFTIIAPFLETSAPESLQASMIFKPCIMTCSNAASCNTALQTYGMAFCPSEAGWNMFQNHSGGTPGFIEVPPAALPPRARV